MYLWFLLWRSIDLLIAFLAQFFIHPSGVFQLRFAPHDFNHQLPIFLQNTGNFDGANYLHIAQAGYGQYQQAYFPLFPLLISLFSHILGDNYFLSGLLLANLSFAIGLIFFRKYLQKLGKTKQQIYWVFIFLLAFPTAFFFGDTYTEGLFFLLITSVLYFLQKKNFTLIFLLATLASLTRLTGIFLIFPLMFSLFEQQLSRIFKPVKQPPFQPFHTIIHYWKLFILTLSPLLGLLIYMLYLSLTTHDPFAFYHAQLHFYNGRSTSSFVFLPQVFYRYLNIFLHAQHTFIYFVSVVEFIVFNLVFWVLLYDLWKLWKEKKVINRLSLLGLNIFSLINLVLPTLTGTLSSTPRYALFSLSFFIRIGMIKNVPLKIALLFSFLVLHIVLLAFFSQGYFVS